MQSSCLLRVAGERHSVALRSDGDGIGYHPFTNDKESARWFQQLESSFQLQRTVVYVPYLFRLYARQSCCPCCCGPFLIRASVHLRLGRPHFTPQIMD